MVTEISEESPRPEELREAGEDKPQEERNLNKLRGRSQGTWALK